jgi:hypothetical protein
MSYYEPNQWLEFQYAEVYDEVPKAKADRLQKRYEKRIEELLDAAMAKGLFDDYPDISEVAYLSFGSQADIGIGLWEGREPWHKKFQRSVKRDKELNSAFEAIEATFLPREAAWRDRTSWEDQQAALREPRALASLPEMLD